MNSHDLFAQFFAKLPNKTLLLTPNRRLSSFLTTQYNQWQQQQNCLVWEALMVQPFSHWLTQLWQNCPATQEKVLSEHQSLMLWQQIIEADQPALLNLEATAKQAMDAARLMYLWQIPARESWFYPPDCRQFFLWYQKYQAYCKARYWLDPHAVASAIVKNVKVFNLQIVNFHQLILIGFDQIPPAWKEFLYHCANLIPIKEDNFYFTPIKKVRYQFSDFKEELLHAATWLKQEHQANPQQRLACIIPNLPEHRSLIEKVFFKLFAGQKFLHLQDQSELPYNISAGRPLQAYGIIACANAILAHTTDRQKRLPLSFVKVLLNSQFIIGYSKEFSQRAQLQQYLLEQNLREIKANTLAHLLQQYCPILSMHFYAWMQQSWPTQTTLSDWLNYFNHNLALLGWPGEGKLTSQNFQLLQRYQELWQEWLTLADFITIDFNSTTCSAHRVVAWLKQTCQTTLFQINTGDKPIQILGALEAAGIGFDQLWLMQTDETLWPAPANPNPFLPHVLQKQFQLPHSSAQREWQFSQTLFNRLSQSAKQVYVSSTELKNQEQINASFLIADWPIEKCAISILDPIHQFAQGYPAEQYNDTKPVPVSAEEKTHLHGGAQIFKTLAACPFQAFARFRLEAYKTPPVCSGLTALERGSIVHKALELFWQRVKSFDQFIQLSPASCAQIVEECGRAALFAIKRYLCEDAPKLMQLELQRLKPLLQNWLDLESQREPFTVIATEELMQTEFAGLPLKLRIDRIDQLASGALILIDYKTAAISTNSWFPPRIDEPQLPLYALIHPKNIDGLLFGQVKAHHFAIKGMVNRQLTISNAKKSTGTNIQNEENWHTVNNNWHHDLTQSAQAFLQGLADIAPKYGQQTCQFCDLASLCRIEELLHDYS